MCIIVHKPCDQIISKEKLKICQENNKDGMGFMYPSHGKVIIKRELKDFDKLYAQYEKTIIETGREKELPVTWHFRVATHGSISLENCHPFITKNGFGFCHNGIVKGIDVPLNSELSDTALFARDIIDGLTEEDLFNKSIQILLQTYIGWSKLVFMFPSKRILYFKKDQGEMADGLWYSNSSYKKREVYVYTTTRNIYHESDDDDIPWNKNVAARFHTYPNNVHNLALSPPPIGIIPADEAYLYFHDFGENLVKTPEDKKVTHPTSWFGKCAHCGMATKSQWEVYNKICHYCHQISLRAERKMN